MLSLRDRIDALEKGAMKQYRRLHVVERRVSTLERKVDGLRARTARRELEEEQSVGSGHLDVGSGDVIKEADALGADVGEGHYADDGKGKRWEGKERGGCASICQRRW